MKTKHIIAAGMFSALSIVLQLMPFWPTTWGMRIDLVAVPWLIVAFMYGVVPGLLSLTASSIVIGFVSESSFLGAVMKFLATAPLIILLGLALMRKDRKLGIILAAFCAAVAIRCIIMLYVNYNYALPIWLKMPKEDIIKNIPSYFIIIPNTAQSIIEAAVSYFVVFKTKLRKRAL